MAWNARSTRIQEAYTLREAAMARLEACDPDLFRAVSWVQAKDTMERTTQMEESYATWRTGALRRTKPLSRVREEFRPPGPEPNLGAVYWRFLRATSFLTAEVAERQTR